MVDNEVLPISVGTDVPDCLLAEVYRSNCRDRRPRLSVNGFLPIERMNGRPQVAPYGGMGEDMQSRIEQSLRLASRATSLYTREALRQCEHTTQTYENVKFPNNEILVSSRL